jgi:hypothetical protein
MLNPWMLTTRVAFQEDVAAFGRDDEINAAIDTPGTWGNRPASL